MTAPTSDEDYKRRARRRLIGAVALAILAIIILPLVLEDEPPPAGPLEVHMPSMPSSQHVEASAVEFAAPPVNASVEPPDAEQVADRETAPAPAAAAPEQPPAKPEKPVTVAKAAEPAEKATDAAIKEIYTVQIGVFADKANVERLQSRITALGMKPYTDQVGKATRIRVGTFATREDADKIVARLAKADIAGKIVEK